ncbi:MAG: hypothetical protein ACRCX2_20280, partial [Paraclostridium sp.]
AGESIANLIEIKANKALLEYNLIIRDVSLLATYINEYNPQENWMKIRELVFTLLNDEDTDKIDELLVSTCKDLDPILVSMSKAYKKILKADE